MELIRYRRLRTLAIIAAVTCAAIEDDAFGWHKDAWACSSTNQLSRDEGCLGETGAPGAAAERASQRASQLLPASTRVKASFNAGYQAGFEAEAERIHRTSVLQKEANASANALAYVLKSATIQKQCPATMLICPPPSSAASVAERSSFLGESSSAQKEEARLRQHCDGKWGFVPPNSTVWQPALWSRSIAIGFQGNSERTEQYQISPPGCPDSCTSRTTPETAIEALKDSSCAEPADFGHVIVSAGYEHTCARTQGSQVVCWGSDAKYQGARGLDLQGIEAVQFSSLSCGRYQCCAIRKDTQTVECWGLHRKAAELSSTFKGVQFSSVSCGFTGCCAIRKDTQTVECWGGKSGLVGAAEFKEVQFSSISCGDALGNTCGIRKDTQMLECWGRSKWFQFNGSMAAQHPQFNGVQFSSLSCGHYQCCAIRKDTQTVECWGSGKAAHIKAVQFSSLSCGYTGCCAIRKDTQTVECWGDTDMVITGSGPSYSVKVSLQVPDRFKGVQFRSVSCGRGHTCAVRKDTEIPECWGTSQPSATECRGASASQCDVPKKTVKWAWEASCLTSHPVVSGPASCTACDPTGCNKFFTIVDPKTNTGTCSRKECPFCKPKACCGAGHKHYVLNTENLEGVCIRHSDDCTPVCVPQGSDDPAVKRVCTKGCNRLLKVLKDKNAKTEGEMFDLVVCQADKQVVCCPRGKVWHVASKSCVVNRSSEEQKSANACTLKASFSPQAICTFSVPLWNLGATCIKGHVYNGTHPQCDDSADKQLISNIQDGALACRKATEKDSKLCSRLGMVY